MTVGVFFANLVVARRERTYEGSVPLVVYGAMTAAIIAAATNAATPSTTSAKPSAAKRPYPC